MNIPCSVTADLLKFESGRPEPRQTRCSDCDARLTDEDIARETRMGLRRKLCYGCRYPCPECGGAGHKDSAENFCGKCEVKFWKKQCDLKGTDSEASEQLLYWLARTVGYAEAA